MNILDLISNDTGIIYKRKSSSEYGGPCFISGCGGEDRMSIIPGKDRFICRRCGIAGDSINFLKIFHNKTYFEACYILGIQPNMKFKSMDVYTDKPNQNNITWKPRKTTIPSLTWQAKAEAVLFESYKYLLSSAGKPHRDYLNNRGISNETIKLARMGYNTSNLTFDAESWGITPEKGESGLNKKIWLPVGILIPYFRDGKPIRIRIRQENPTSGDRFILVAGSNTDYFDYNSHSQKQQNLSLPVIITESEIDGHLINQEAGNICSIYAVGNASARPDERTHAAIKDLPIILNLDDDEAGKNEVDWWKKQYDFVLAWTSQMGKDPGEDFEAGCNIREWVKTGLSNLSDKVIEIKPDLKQKSFKDLIYEKFDKKQNIPEIAKKEQKTVKKEQKSTRKDQFHTCLHNLYCYHLKDGLCLIDGKNIAEDDKICPKEKWIAWKSGAVTEIILGVGVEKSR